MKLKIVMLAAVGFVAGLGGQMMGGGAAMLSDGQSIMAESQSMMTMGKGMTLAPARFAVAGVGGTGTP